MNGKRFSTFDLANGDINMLNQTEYHGGGWYIKRHYRRNYNGERIGEYFTIHQRRQFISRKSK